MNVRATLSGIFASAAILGIGWQFGAAAAHTYSELPANTPATSAPTSPPAEPGSAQATTSPSAPTPSTAPTSGTPSIGPASGTYVGSVESTPYGDVQVEIVTSSGTISDVKALRLTDEDGRSVQISNHAAPLLRSEVLSSQSAHVHSVSGATYTSEGYLSSVQSAIDKAGL